MKLLSLRGIVQPFSIDHDHEVNKEEPCAKVAHAFLASHSLFLMDKGKESQTDSQVESPKPSPCTLTNDFDYTLSQINAMELEVQVGHWRGWILPYFMILRRSSQDKTNGAVQNRDRANP